MGSERRMGKVRVPYDTGRYSMGTSGATPYPYQKQPILQHPTSVFATSLGYGEYGRTCTPARCTSTVPAPHQYRTRTYPCCRGPPKHGSGVYINQNHSFKNTSKPYPCKAEETLPFESRCLSTICLDIIQNWGEWGVGGCNALVSL